MQDCWCYKRRSNHSNFVREYPRDRQRHRYVDIVKSPSLTVTVPLSPCRVKRDFDRGFSFSKLLGFVSGQAQGTWSCPSECPQLLCPELGDVIVWCPQCEGVFCYSCREPWSENHSICNY